MDNKIQIQNMVFLLIFLEKSLHYIRSMEIFYNNLLYYPGYSQHSQRVTYYICTSGPSTPLSLKRPLLAEHVCLSGCGKTATGRSTEGI